MTPSAKERIARPAVPFAIVSGAAKTTMR